MHDTGKEFEAEVKLLCEILGVTELKTAPKSPHSNGSVERLHRELEAELVRFRAATHTRSPLEWTRYVPAILIKLRSTINKSTKFSPYELMGAKSPILAGTVPEPEGTEYDFTTEFGTDQQWEQWIKRRQEKRAVGITEMTKTIAPPTAQVNTTTTGQHQNIPVALAKINNGINTTYEIIEYSSKAKAAQIFKQYKNTRPQSQASMAKWVKTSITVSNPQVIDEFHLTWNPTSKTYIIPRTARQRNRTIAAIQGRKATAHNTGGNP